MTEPSEGTGLPSVNPGAPVMNVNPGASTMTTGVPFVITVVPSVSVGIQTVTAGTSTVNPGISLNAGTSTVNPGISINAGTSTVNPGISLNAGTSTVNTGVPTVSPGTTTANAGIPVVDTAPTVSIGIQTVNAETSTSASGTETTAGNAATPPKDATVSDRDCAVCLETMVQPTELPCKHVFCFLCVKGIAQKTRCCALCRREIPLNYFDSPHLLNDPAPEKEKGKACCDDEDRPLWYYKGRSGWWQYDERTCQELESAFSKGSAFCEVLIAGFLYTIDFKIMTQIRKDDPKRRRAIRRETQNAIPVKGVAGVHASNQGAGSSPKKPKLNHKTSHACDVDAGPSCSVFVINLPSTSGSNSGPCQQKGSGRCRKDSSDTDEAIVLSSDDSSDEFYGFDDSDDTDNASDSDDSDDSNDSDGGVARFVFHLDTYANCTTKRKASSAKVPSSSKKRQQLSSAEYKTTLDLMKAEHKHIKESMKLKHIRSLVDKKTPKEIELQKKLNYNELQQLEKKQRKEHQKFLRQHPNLNNLYG